jgi:hypothetical protein
MALPSARLHQPIHGDAPTRNASSSATRPAEIAAPCAPLGMDIIREWEVLFSYPDQTIKITVKKCDEQRPV